MPSRRTVAACIERAIRCVAPHLADAKRLPYHYQRQRFNAGVGLIAFLLRCGSVTPHFIKEFSGVINRFMQTYMTKGTCSRQIIFDVTEDERLTNVKFIGGCSGNLQAVARLVEGKPVQEVISLLKGIKCRGNTSCGDQLATALERYLDRKANPELYDKKKGL